MSNFTFSKFTKADLATFVSTREKETRIGEITYVGLENDAQFALLFINEDIGPQTNLGRPGAGNASTAFLSRFLNMQDTPYLSGRKITFIGQIIQNTTFSSVEEGKKQVTELDELVQKQVELILENGKTPILIGGGHNNAFPIIKAYNSTFGKKLDVINLDPHADTRALEGRHSGNSFSYALTNKWIEKYTVLGLHKPYNSVFILDFLKEHNCSFTFFDQYITGENTLENDMEIIAKSPNLDLGVELDMDSIAYMPSSAMGPSGWQMEEARKYILLLKKSKRKLAYLHLPEAAPITSEEQIIVGKALAYLVYDFIA